VIDWGQFVYPSIIGWMLYIAYESLVNKIELLEKKFEKRLKHHRDLFENEISEVIELLEKKFEKRLKHHRDLFENEISEVYDNLE